MLRPEGVAIVGASQDATKRGHQVVRALVESRYSGGVFPVHPRGGELLGLPVAPSIGRIAGNPDLALICTPAASVPTVLEACVEKGIRGAIVLAAGFGELGSGGSALEAEAMEIARRGGIRVVGPNTSGVLNLGIDLNLIGVSGLRRGNLALLVQSGNTALSLLRRASERGGGVSICVGVGNEADIRFDEYLDYLEADTDTSAILMYVDGFRDGRAFLDAARRVGRTKPIVLLKGGRSEAGCAAARSHTGAVAGEYRSLQAALRQAGVIEAERSDELLAIAETLAGQPPVASGKGVAVLSDGGGQAVVAADDLMKRGMPLAALAAETETRLRALLGPAAALGNPVDVAGAGDRRPGIFAETLRILTDDPSVGGVLMIGLFGGYALRFARVLEPAEMVAAGAMIETARETKKPLVLHSIYADSRSPPLERLCRAGIPVIESVEVACAAMDSAVRRGQFLGEATSAPGAGNGRTVHGGAASPGGASLRIAAARREGRSALLEPEARELVAGYGVPLAPAHFCDSSESVRAAAERLGGPVVLKVLAPALLHKSDGGGVLLDIPDPDAAVRGFVRVKREVASHLEALGLDPDIRGALISPMLPAPLAELLIGVRRDSVFGPVLTFGAGGTLVELLQDTSLRILPIGPEEALAMQDEVRVDALLRGFRGRPSVDRGLLTDALLALARCALDHPELSELEVNPVFAYSDRLLAVDVRAALAPATNCPATEP